MKELKEKFKSIISAESAFKDVPKPRKNETVFWLKPLLVAQIKFAECTEDSILRQASCKGLRTDKNPKEVKRENSLEDPETLAKPKEKEADRMSVTVNGVTISSPDKAMYEEPLITKKDLAEYYSQATERMLPYVGNRIPQCHTLSQRYLVLALFPTRI